MCVCVCVCVCPPQEAEATPDSFTKLRLHLATSLYYKLLLGVVRDEVEVKKVSVTTLQIMLEHELFHKALFALSTEIVLFSYNSQSRCVVLKTVCVKCGSSLVTFVAFILLSFNT